ncbi:MAG: class I SAM-dependent methyltransferase [Nanoarchaeota archaeon]
MSRIKRPKELEGADHLQYTEEDRRFGTPQVVAEYRAGRLACKIIADLGCGVGFQTIAFAKTCKHVYAVEKDLRKLEYAQTNAFALGLTNITFIHGDALDPSIVSQLKECQTIFCDTERPPQEAERTLASLAPNPLLLIETYSSITPNLCIEVPPHLSDIPFDCEREYLSLNGRLNRLTLYLGGLKKTEKSVTLLPENHSLYYTGKKMAAASCLPPQFKYLYEVNPAVVIAELIGELGDYDFFTYLNKLYAASMQAKPSFFLRGYRVLARTSLTLTDIKEALHKNGAGKVTLRQKIDPQDYWKERKKYEEGLTGTKKVHLFIFEEALLCEEIYDKLAPKSRAV